MVDLKSIRCAVTIAVRIPGVRGANELIQVAQPIGICVLVGVGWIVGVQREGVLAGLDEARAGALLLDVRVEPSRDRRRWGFALAVPQPLAQQTLGDDVGMKRPTFVGEHLCDGVPEVHGL